MEPYKFIETRFGNYSLVTEHNNEYEIYFSKYWQQDVVDLYAPVNIKVYELYFEPVRIEKKFNDKRLSYTVMSILQTFLKENDCAVFYATQRDDGRNQELFTLYKFWLRSFLQYMNEPVSKLDRAVFYEGLAESFISCIVLNRSIEESDMSADQVLDLVLAEIYPRATICVM
jgi:hypothetical protein